MVTMNKCSPMRRALILFGLTSLGSACTKSHQHEERWVSIGSAQQFSLGWNILEAQQLGVWVDERGIAVMGMLCTHQRCPVHMISGTSEGFVCPCHGSEFSPKGTVTRGPASTDLPWYQIRTGDNNLLEVNLGTPTTAESRYALL